MVKGRGVLESALGEEDRIFLLSLPKRGLMNHSFEILKDSYPFDCGSLYWIEKNCEGKDLSRRRKED